MSSVTHTAPGTRMHGPYPGHSGHEPSQQCLSDTRVRVHAHCIACGARNGQSGRLSFAVGKEGAVEAHIDLGPDYEGYDGILHGGVIATLLDAAMTNCLFAHCRCGVTADLHLRYRHPVMSAQPCVVRAWIERWAPPLFVLQAELSQSGQRKVTAVGKFMLKADSG